MIVLVAVSFAGIEIPVLASGVDTDAASISEAYSIHNLSLDAKEATATLTASQDCALFIAFYIKEGRMLDVRSAPVMGSTGVQNISVELLPERVGYEQAKAFLIDSQQFTPLCEAFSLSGPVARSAVTEEKNVPMFTLNNGVHMPQLGLGNQIQSLERDSSASGRALLNETSRQATVAALQAGYRHLDTAHGYYNERGVGQGIIDSGVPREDIWLTSKLWPSEYGEGVTLDAIDTMLERLQTDYIDLIYLHHPAGDYVGAKYM